ncbi:hypothetical protein N7456_007990 [Penicillium angulare]|uniref:Uncharacterized protein n=1 Tax=Penicillium angulare TaxID=116970 RepID=A0A9W9FBT4_9EURO|nr:hypothetical protein N7456_007990 [Penicillium angulare]
MLLNSVTALLLASSLAAAELEKKQYGYDDSYYSSLEDSLNSLATNTDYDDYMDYLTEYSDIYTDMPTDYTPYMPDATDAPESTDAFNDATVTPPPSMPTVTYDMPPPSIESVLATAIPDSYLSEMADPSAASSLISSIQNGDMPSWYEDLPTSVKSWLSEHYATGAMPAATGSTSGDHEGGRNSAPPSGMVATGLMGAAGILAVAVLL